jgi:O-antigen biosynthesis protein
LMVSGQTADGETLVAPVAVRLIDLDGGLNDVKLPPSPALTRYERLLAIGRREGRPVGVAVLAPSSDEVVSRDAIAAAFDGMGHEYLDSRSISSAPLSAMASDVTVVVPTCGSDLELLTACVRALLSQTSLPLEVVVVDNRPDRSAVEALIDEEFGREPSVRYAPEPIPGLSRARNAGVGAARGEYVAFVDDDVIADPGWLAAARQRFDVSGEVACVTGLILPSELETPAQVMFDRFAGFGKGFTARTYSLSSPPDDQPLFPYTPGRFGSGANAVFRAAALRALAGFDEALGAGTKSSGGEDVDIYLRIITSGATLVYEPAALVWHRHPRTERDLQRRVFRYGLGLGAMLAKHALAGQDRLRILPRLPGGLVYLVHPGSGRNRRKGPGFPRRLTLLELLGVLMGPLAYIRSRCAAAKALESHDERAVPTTETKIWCGEVDINDPRQRPDQLLTDDGAAYTHARLLVRSGREPVGFVDVSLDDGWLAPAEVARELDRFRAGLTAPEARSSQGALDGDQGSADQPMVTVAVCTRGRPAELERCMQGLRGIDYERLEILVVDNAPENDDVEQAFYRAIGTDQRFRYTREPRPGLSCARNHAVSEAAGDIIAFTDDDVRVDADWVRGLVAGFARHPNVGCVTGLVASAALETRAEQYFDARVWWSSSCGHRLYLPERGPLDSSLHPFSAGAFGTGANMAFRRDLIVALGSFDELLGAGSPTSGGEDLDAFVRVLRSDHALSYEPSALVWHEHRAGDEELTKQMYAYGKGLGAYATKYLLRPDTALAILHRVPRALVHLLVLGHRSQSAATRADIPRTVQIAELHGLFAGPIAYLRAR